MGWLADRIKAALAAAAARQKPPVTKPGAYPSVYPKNDRY